MIQIAVVEDDPQTAQAIQKQIHKYLASVHTGGTVAIFSNGQDFLTCTTRFHLVFLDIQLGALSGMETAKRFRARGEMAFLIFVTVLPEYVYEAFAVEAFDYLVKPLDAARLTQTLHRLWKKIQNMDRQVFWLSPAQWIAWREICYCEAQNHTIEIHTTAQCYATTQETMRTLQEKLDARFFRCHRSYLVNLDHVIQLHEGFAVLTDGTKVPISRLRAKQFSQALLNRLGEQTVGQD